MEPFGINGPIRLNHLEEVVYRGLKQRYANVKNENAVEVLDMHHHLKYETKKWEYEVLNEPVYNGINNFRAWLNSEIAEYGPGDLVQRKRDRLILQNKNFRSRNDPDGDYKNWSNEEYLLKPAERLAYAREIDLKEAADTTGNVSLDAQTGTYSQNWKVYDVPAWIKDESVQGPPIELSEIKGIRAEISTMLASEDKLVGHIAKLDSDLSSIRAKRRYLINSHKEFFNSPQSQEKLKEIHQQKAELVELKIMRVQIERLEKDNKNYQTPAETTIHPQPEEPTRGNVVDLLN